MIFVQNSDAVEAGSANPLYRGGKGFRHFPMTASSLTALPELNPGCLPQSPLCCPSGKLSPESLLLSLPPFSVWKSKEGSMLYTSPPFSPCRSPPPETCPAHVPKHSSSCPSLTCSHGASLSVCFCVRAGAMQCD